MVEVHRFDRLGSRFKNLDFYIGYLYIDGEQGGAIKCPYTNSNARNAVRNLKRFSFPPTLRRPFPARNANRKRHGK